LSGYSRQLALSRLIAGKRLTCRGSRNGLLSFTFSLTCKGLRSRLERTEHRSEVGGESGNTARYRTGVIEGTWVRALVARGSRRIVPEIEPAATKPSKSSRSCTRGSCCCATTGAACYAAW